MARSAAMSVNYVDAHARQLTPETFEVVLTPSRPRCGLWRFMRRSWRGWCCVDSVAGNGSTRKATNLRYGRKQVFSLRGAED